MLPPTAGHFSIEGLNRNLPRLKTIRYNPFVERFSNFIKHLCILLVKHEQVVTGRGSARKLGVYGNLLIDLCNRTEPPPDLERIKNGFILHDIEVDYDLTTCILKNNKKRRRLVLLNDLTQEEFRDKCNIEISNILLNDIDAINKLKNEIAPRYTHMYGNYTKTEFYDFPDANQRPRYGTTYFKKI